MHKILKTIMGAGLAVALGVSGAFAQNLELNIMAPAGAGGGWDSAARSVQEAMTASGQAASAQVYNVTGAGEPTTWADIARDVYGLRGRDPGSVTPVSTETYGAGKQLAPRPEHSSFDLGRLRATGFVPEDASVALRRYLADWSAGS